MVQLSGEKVHTLQGRNCGNDGMSRGRPLPPQLSPSGLVWLFPSTKGGGHVAAGVCLPASEITQKINKQTFQKKTIWSM